ncbi:Alpha/Beta hydrolase protein [Clohesyomyces aquaticus]|uniref:Carboxypeptidase n=1 Tax=Clohesyomyces aquaticus TaxID=1231657 RepID=A0A1Y1ZS02_9PLEO|nr:Alpha/Beta hydrolase protein [Clohesyomyces aquaticus]
MRALLSFIFSVLVSALPQQPQRPILLEELIAGRVNSSDITSECFETLDATTSKTETVCLNNVVEPGRGDKNQWNWGASKQYCGYIHYPNRDAYYYFWLVLSEKNAVKAPLVLWLNGGPGVSSLVGLFDQWGPARVLRRKVLEDPREETKLGPNQFRVTEDMSWVFLEYPIGVGFSHGSYMPTTSAEATEDVYRFLDGFFQYNFMAEGKRVDFLQNDFHIAGESYAGKYIPAIGETLLRRAWPKNLKSLIIGNGAIDPVQVVTGMLGLFCGRNGPLLDIKEEDLETVKERCKKADLESVNCLSSIERCRLDSTSCGKAVEEACWQSTEGWAEALNKDLYDYTKSKVLNNKREMHLSRTLKYWVDGVKPLIGADATPKWQYKSEEVAKAFRQSGDVSASYIPALSFVLEKELKVLLYAGDKDLAVPFTAVKNMAEELDWESKHAFIRCLRRSEEQQTPLGPPGSAKYGSYTRINQLTFARIYDAGHMINENGPAEAKDMWRKWILSNDEFENCK